MTFDMNAEIVRLAPFLNKLQKSEQAKRNYHLLSDAFVWTDEIPQEEIGEDVVLRYLLRYRTSVMIGKPLESLVSYWETARSAFPRWPGFSPERCQYSADAVREYEELQAKEEDFLENFNVYRYP